MYRLNAVHWCLMLPVHLTPERMPFGTSISLAITEISFWRTDLSTTAGKGRQMGRKAARHAWEKTDSRSGREGRRGIAKIE